jgi:hypothetical protein
MGAPARPPGRCQRGKWAGVGGAAMRAARAPRATRRAGPDTALDAGAAGQRTRLDCAAVTGGAGARAQAAGCVFWGLAACRPHAPRSGAPLPGQPACSTFPCLQSSRPLPFKQAPQPPPTGEDPPPGADRGALLARLAARRLAERARIVRLPLRLTFAGRRSSRRYLTVPIDCGDIGFVDFLLEAGSYNCLIGPELRDRLGLGPADGAAVRALDSRGPTVRQRVELPPMWLGEWEPGGPWGGGQVGGVEGRVVGGLPIGPLCSRDGRGPTVWQCWRCHPFGWVRRAAGLARTKATVAGGPCLVTGHMRPRPSMCLAEACKARPVAPAGSNPPPKPPAPRRGPQARSSCPR